MLLILPEGPLQYLLSFFSYSMGYFDFLHFSAMEMIIGTLSSVTVLMVFLILGSQNKDSLSIQLKLNELVAANSRRATAW